MPRNRVDDDDQIEAKIDVERPSFPVAAMLAGSVWTGFGLIVVFGVAITSAMRSGPEQLWWPTVGVGLIGLVYLVSGIQAIRGQLSGLLPASIVSFLFALFYCGVGALSFGTIRADPQDEQILHIVLGAVCVMVGLGLFAAGLLGVIGNSSYKRWREATNRAKPERRPRDED